MSNIESPPASKPRYLGTAILMALFLDLFGFGMIIADFQLRAESMVPKGWQVGLTIGAILGSTFLIQILTSPRWGRLSDRIGRKPVLLICSALSSAAMWTYGLAAGLAMLLLSRLLAGFGGANVAIAQAVIADEFDGDERASWIGKIGAAVSAGLILGPVAGGALVKLERGEWIGYAAGAISTLGVLLLTLSVPHHRPKPSESKSSRKLFDFAIFHDIPKLVPLAIMASCAWFSLAMLEGTFGRLINILYGYDQFEFGMLFGYEGLLGVLIQGVLLGWIAKRIKTTPLLRTSYILQGIGLLLNPFAFLFQPLLPPLAVLFIASTIYAIGAGIANPTLSNACSSITPQERQGELFGVLQSARSVGFLFGPLIGGLLFDSMPAAPYVIACLVSLVVAFLVPKVES